MGKTNKKAEAVNSTQSEVKKKNFPVWVIVLIILISLGGCVACINKLGNDESGDQVKETEQQEKEEEDNVDYEVLGEYRNEGLNTNWTAITVASDITEEELVELARKLHSENSEMRYNILDAKPSSFSKWKKTETENLINESINNWNEKHYIAIINLMFHKDGNKWQLVPMGLKTEFDWDKISVDL